ncbi:hypothetical protein [Halalkalicoccus subterraneus]|uniref:hypothetical protein n=1 Tax=Halalkalicoccus subterraneus TaxID=2675002 RepID=UPI000EFD4D6A|nr:hypothetical protein [Halalkalicoccus subterraneus]
MDTTHLAAELGSDDPELPPAEAAFIDAVETAQAKLATDEITREEYDERIRTASDRYRSATSSDADPGVGVDSPDEP